MNNLGEDQIRSAVRSLGTSTAGAVTPDLAQVKTMARRRWRNAAAAVTACVVVATVGVATAARTERGSNAPVAEAPAPVENPSCGPDFILELATAQQVEEEATALTVCSWSNAASGDAARDARSTLEAELRLSEVESAALLDALRAAEPAEPSCYLIDSPPPLTYEILIPTTDGVRSVSIADMECLGFSLIEGSPLSSSRVLNAIRAFKDLETQELTVAVRSMGYNNRGLPTGLAFWNAADQSVVFRPSTPYSCRPVGAATRSDTTINLSVTESDASCGAIPEQMEVTISGLSEAPTELTVTEDGKTSAMPVEQEQDATQELSGSWSVTLPGDDTPGLSMSFTNDRVRVTVGCADYRGEYKAAGSNIRFDGVGGEEPLCATGPLPDVLDAARSVTAPDGETRELRDADDEVIAVLTRTVG